MEASRLLGRAAATRQAVRGPDPRNSRYRGLHKSHVQNVLTGMALNVTRPGARYDTHGQGKDNTEHKAHPVRPPTRVHRLCREHGLTASTADAT